MIVANMFILSFVHFNGAACFFYGTLEECQAVIAENVPTGLYNNFTLTNDY